MVIVVHLLRINLYDTGEGEVALSPGDIMGTIQLSSTESPKAGAADGPWGSLGWDVLAEPELFVGKLLPTFSTGGLSQAGDICTSFALIERSEWKLEHLLVGSTSPWTGVSTWWQESWQSFILSPPSWLCLRRTSGLKEAMWPLSLHGWKHYQHNLCLLHSTSKIWGLLTR